MRKLFIIIYLFILIGCLQIANSKLSLAESNFYYTKDVEHLFTHSLIAHTEIAFNENNFMKKHYLNDCITTLEFETILENLFTNNYVLVSINDCFETNDGIAVRKKIKVPNGKKAIILSFDDVNYDQKKQGLGMVDKIILDENNEIATSTVIDGTKQISHSNEFVTILENFVKNNPSFSPYGAKGTINLTGYDGVLGYRTSHTNTKNRDDEIKEAQLVANKLKQLGWTFASHSYGHYHMKKISDQKFENELKLWKQEVEPIVGKTEVYVYPYGEWEVFDNGNLCTKHQLLNKYGFKLFCGVGMKTFFSYLPNKNGHKILFMDRKCVDGFTLSNNHSELTRFFNPALVLDKARTMTYSK